MIRAVKTSFGGSGFRLLSRTSCDAHGGGHGGDGDERQRESDIVQRLAEPDRSDDAGPITDLLEMSRRRDETAHEAGRSDRKSVG